MDAQLEDGAEFGEEMVEIIKSYVEKKIAPLERRIAQLEAHGPLKYVGIWRANTEYLPGNFTTTNGCLWHCEQPTRSRPGTDATWKMAAKSGTFS